MFVIVFCASGVVLYSLMSSLIVCIVFSSVSM